MRLSHMVEVLSPPLLQSYDLQFHELFPMQEVLLLQFVHLTNTIDNGILSEAGVYISGGAT